MKKIKRLIENIEKLMTFHHWNDYRLIITNRNVELKLTPKKDKDKEMYWIIANEKETILNLCFQLEQMIENGEY